MLTYKRTSLLEANAQTLVNTVNCVGVMGKGIAKEFKKRDPKMFESYKKICDEKLLQPGKLWLWRGSANWVLNFPTKKHWRSPSKIEWVEAGLEKFVSTYESQGITEISFPKLGCGNGGLDWDVVRPIMERYLVNLSIPVYVHDFTKEIGLPEHLEKVASEISACGNRDMSFSSFIEILERIAKISPEIAVEGDLSFRCAFEGGNLQIESGGERWTFEEDDLRGVWISLLNGLVTKEKAGWTASGGAMPLITMMRLMPDVRGVQIHRSGRPEPEIAVELTPVAAMFSDALIQRKQPQLPWH